MTTEHVRRHRRRVRDAGRRAGYCDELELCDDWVIQWLKRARIDAQAAGHDLETVNDWTMSGLIRGRQEAREHDA